MQIDVMSIGRQSCDSRDWDHLSSNKSKKNKVAFCNASVKSRDRFRGEIQSQFERKNSKKKHKCEDGDYKSVINRLVRENRRLQTEHVREIYSREVKESVKKQRWG